MRKRLNGLASRRKGIDIESLALAWLRKRGLGLLFKNYRCKPGEIDLVMREQDTLVFVEVRYRYHSQFGGSLESVDWRKQKKLLLAARHFLATQRRYQHMPCRFDVMAASPSTEPSGSLDWQWIKNAFSA